MPTTKIRSLKARIGFAGRTTRTKKLDLSTRTIRSEGYVNNPLELKCTDLLNLRPMLKSYTELLGETLVTARFALIGNDRHEYLYLGDTLIKKWPANKYSLKAIKRYCRYYLRDQAAKHRPRQHEFQLTTRQ